MHVHPEIPFTTIRPTIRRARFSLFQIGVVFQEEVSGLCAIPKQQIEAQSSAVVRGQLVTTNTLIAAATADQNEIERVLRSQIAAFPVKLVSEETIKAVTHYARQFQAYTEAKNKILDRIAKARVFTV